MAALLIAVVSLASGCGSTGRSDQGANAEQTAASQEARCRAAIADVNKACSGENANQSRCDDAKARSRATCI